MASVLLVGDLDDRDFEEPVCWLSRSAECTVCANFQAACEQLEQGLLPQIIVIAQSRPGQFTPSQIERLHAASPLSRLVALLGSWCEGELRTGRPWPGVVRILWHQWQPRMKPELASVSGGRPSLWNLPRTASHAEQLAHAARQPWPRGGGLVAVHTPARSMYQAYRDACLAAGYAAVWVAPHQSVDLGGVAAAIWDGVSCGDGEALEIQQLTQRYAPAPIVALMDFVRRQDYDRALEAGAVAVLAKPLSVFDLLWHLHQATSARRPAAAGPSSVEQGVSA